MICSRKRKSTQYWQKLLYSSEHQLKRIFSGLTDSNCDSKSLIQRDICGQLKPAEIDSQSPELQLALIRQTIF